MLIEDSARFIGCSSSGCIVKQIEHNALGCFSFDLVSRQVHVKCCGSCSDAVPFANHVAHSCCHILLDSSPSTLSLFRTSGMT